MKPSTRRRFLRSTAAVSVAGIAGCMGASGPGVTAAATVPGSDYPALDRWLTETQVGGAAGNYDGNVQDLTGQNQVTIDVGAQGNDGNFAFAPPAVLVATGTEVRWRWTGQGNPHNVEAEPGEQLGESDYTFSSGPPVGGSGVKFTQTMGKPGLALYHCEPHLALGMKGGVAVE